MLEHPGFFDRKGPFPLAEVVAATGATPARAIGHDLQLHDIKTLQSATPRDLSFLDNRKYISQASVAQAGACLIRPDLADRLPANVLPMVTGDPYRAFAKALFLFYPDAGHPLVAGDVTAGNGAPIHPTARIEDGVTIEPGAVIGAGAEIGRGTRVAANAVIGSRVTVGRNCFIGPGSRLIHCLIGDRVIIHPGARLGQDGFGFARGGRRWLKTPQLGRVIVQDDVEIGANSTIDRGATRDTIIGEGSKIDNLVQIGHNVVLGRFCVIAAQTGIAGSSEIGDFVLLGGQSAIAGHLRIGAGAAIAAKSGVMRDIPAGARVGGAPARPIRRFLRAAALIDRMAGRETRE